MIDPNFLLGLAPSNLPILRPARYQGDQMSATLSQLDPGSQDAVRRLYELLTLAHKLLQESAEGERPTDAVVQELASRSLWTDLVKTGRELQQQKDRHSEVVGRVIHDLRGGSLVALIGTVQMLPFSESPQVDVHRCAHFARDHLKIMRNCLPEIDPVAVRRDREERAHDIDLIVEKWAGSEFRVDNVSRRIRFSCTFHGTISKRCMEFSAIDRVVYNLINNAVAHTADGEVELSIFPVGTEGPPNVRFVVFNAIKPGDSERIRSLANGQIDRLMEGGVSTTAGGMGLRICAEFVCRAYGLRSVDEVLRGGYAGTRIHDDTFLSWFHWPSAA